MELDLRYPIGKYTPPSEITRLDLEGWIGQLAEFPERLKGLTKNLTAEELNYTYRPEGWNIKQVVHHCADSHLNMICRFKLALTEENPTIRPYYEDRWAKLPDNDLCPITVSLDILQGIHSRLVAVLKTLSEEQWQRTYFHPEHKQKFNLKFTAGMYAWHSMHHLAHVIQALERKVSD